MGTKNFYDVICLGHGLSPLLACALLAKRGFRVLLLGQGVPPPSYGALGVRFPRSPFTLTHHGSPALARIFAELALRPLLARRSRLLSPAFQLVLPGHRVDFGASVEAVSQEIEREFPAIRRPTEDFLRAADTAWQRIHPFVERDLMWPPTRFLEKREMNRAAQQAPFGREDPGERPLSELADDHPVLASIAARLRFLDGSELGAGNAQRELREIAGALRPLRIDGGYAGLWEMLLDCIRTHNGDVRLLERAEQIEVRRGGLGTVRLLPSDEEVGCQFLLSGLSIGRLSRLLSDRRLIDDMLDELGPPRPRHYRYTLNLLVPNDAIPEGMARSVLLVPDAHKVDGEHRLWIEADPLEDGAHTVLSVEALVPALLPDDEEAYMSDMRERVLTSLALLSPFLLDRVVAIDSPHDGRPVRDVRQGRDVSATDPWPRGPGSMQALYAYARTGVHGCTALPVRTPIKHLLLCNEQVVPGLGIEGSFLCAWSAARAVTRTLGRQWMNRNRWTKVEL